jgi:hypothetical protein
MTGRTPPPRTRLGSPALLATSALGSVVLGWLAACSAPTSDAGADAARSDDAQRALGDEIPAEALPKTMTPRAGRGSDLVGLAVHDASRRAPPEEPSDAASDPVDPAIAEAAKAQVERDAKARAAFGDALGAAFLDGDLEAVGRWTRFGSRALAKRCRDLESPREEELDARIAHCAKVIPWSTLDDATLSGGERKGPHAECEPGIDGLTRIRLTLVSGARRFHLDVLDPVADDEGVLGFGGHLTCSEVKPRPPLDAATTG